MGGPEPEVPFSHDMIRWARQMGVPPWSLEHPDRPPTEGEVSRWVTLIDLYERLGVL